MMTTTTTGSFQASSWVNAAPQWQQAGSTFGVIRLQAPQIRRGADGSRPQTPHRLGVAAGLPQ
jgi:hypothetical protein